MSPKITLQRTSTCRSEGSRRIRKIVSEVDTQQTRKLYSLPTVPRAAAVANVPLYRLQYDANSRVREQHAHLSERLNGRQPSPCSVCHIVCVVFCLFPPFGRGSYGFCPGHTEVQQQLCAGAKAVATRSLWGCESEANYAVEMIGCREDKKKLKYVLRSAEC